METGVINILSTKILKPDIISKALKRGIKFDQLPFITTSILETDKLRSDINAIPTTGIRAIFTSKNAVEAVKKHLALSPDWEIYCINGATLEAVQNYFSLMTHIISASDARFLADLLKEQNDLKETWYFCGNKRLDILPDVLKDLKIQWHEVVVYNTRLNHHNIDSYYDGILFFSPSAVQSYFETNTISENTVCFAFGRSTMNKLSENTDNPIILNTTPDQQAMLLELNKYFKK